MRGNLMPLALAALLTIAGCGAGSRNETVPAANPQIVKGITVEQLQLAELAEQHEAVGTVKALNSAVVSARIAGVITTMNVKEGDRVVKGRVLATIEANEVSAAAAAAGAGVEEAKQALEEALSRKKLSDATLQRYQKLFAEQAVTRQEFESRQTEQEVAYRGVTRAESRLVLARESARGAEATANYTRIVAPINGTVVARMADRGATVFPGMPILTIEEDSGFRLEVQVPESLKGKVSVGEAVDVSLGSLPIQKGRVVEAVPIVDPGSRTFTAKIALSAKGVRSGEYGRVFFPVGTIKGITAPKGALVERGALNSVWVVDSANIARMRLVKPGKTVGERVEILSGLTPGERIVVKGMEKVTDGVKVE
jgi:RND family efflux transporter MFP subunit